MNYAFGRIIISVLERTLEPKEKTTDEISVSPCGLPIGLSRRAAWLQTIFCVDPLSSEGPDPVVGFLVAQIHGYSIIKIEKIWTGHVGPSLAYYSLISLG